MYHCHMLVHEDGGMMGQFLVVDSSNTNISNNLARENGIQIYPNPANEQDVFIKSENQISYYEIFNTSGLLIKKQEFNNLVYNAKIETKFLPAGVYILKINVDGIIFTDKLINY